MSATVLESQLYLLPGTCFPLGATIVDGGVNFSVFSKHATGMELLLFSSLTQGHIKVIQLDPVRNKTNFYWHIFIPGLADGQEYGFRAQGPFDPSRGLRFDPEKLLVDPYAKAVAGWVTFDRQAACSNGNNCAKALKSVVVDPSSYDWEDDKPLRTPFAESVIYEMHVGGFTRNSNSGVPPEKRGTFAGVVEKIPYLKELGVTALELMPVQEFDPEAPQPGLQNYWGYSTLAFLAPHHGYCQNGNSHAGIGEFRDMVKALHKAGMEVILDVVFNHTAEGNEQGPTLSFRGLGNPIYYQLDLHDKSRYSNFSGCGNSFNANHPVVGRLILDSLRYWVKEMHVDGFRFDLAAALARDIFGQPLALPPLLWAIESDPVLAGTKLIAEAWDAAGLYRVGWFVNVSNWYAEWNGPFRDDVRRFVKGDRGAVSGLSARLTGSSDLYVNPEREPHRSINFVTCHDGFTLNDLVTFNSKHNERNGESNRDGCDANFSWNCGSEGQTNEREIQTLRLRQMKNMLTILFVSQGTPMLLMGDEIGRSQQGNNNAYCHNNELTWFDWSLLEQNNELFRFVKELIGFTQSLECFRQRKTIGNSKDRSSIIWHGVKLEQPDWSVDSHALAFTLENQAANERLHVMLNAYWEVLEFELPGAAINKVWRRVVDTSLSAPADISRLPDAEALSGSTYKVMPRSSVLAFEQLSSV